MLVQFPLPSGRRCRGAYTLVLMWLGALTCLPAWAAADQGGNDCAPAGTLPNYLSRSAPERSNYDTFKFCNAPAETEDRCDTTVDISGRTCEQNYYLKTGAQAMSQLEIAENYKSQLGQLGAQIVHFDEAGKVVAKLVANKQETWVAIDTDGNRIGVKVVDRQGLAYTLLPPSTKDYHLLGHMPHYTLASVDKKNFDQASFGVHNADGDSDVKVQGAYYKYDYRLDQGAQQPTGLEVHLNYRHAIEQLGGEVLYAGDYSTTARFDDKGQLVWVDVETNGGDTSLAIIEEKAFQATIQPPRASAMKTALDKDGQVALNIDFDFDKATLRADAAPIIAQVVELLKSNPDLRLSIQGNTDNVGSHDYNVKLSQDRAAAVVTALVKAGIAAGRLTSAGNGPDKPVADNSTTDGRAKNRRVELVKV